VARLEAADSSANPLAARPPCFRRGPDASSFFSAKRPSQVDTFDYKPCSNATMATIAPSKPRFSRADRPLKSPWNFSQHGQSGAWVSELFPHLATRVDDLCFLKGMHGSNSRHGGALLELHTGSDTLSDRFGSWVATARRENRDRPASSPFVPR
jgi:hypothetical protein